MTRRLLRLAAAALASLLLAGVLKVLLLDVGVFGRGSGQPIAGLFKNSLRDILVQGLPPAVLFVLATELLRLRRLDVQLALGTALCFAAALVATRGEGPTSGVYDGGALAVLALFAIGMAASVAYWSIAGRTAGWRGDDEERMDALAAEAFARAGAGARVEPCGKCLAIALGLGLAAFAFAAWGLIEVGGLRKRLIADAEGHGQAALASEGHSWATFTIVGSNGVISGVAPDELERRKALDAVRNALYASTGLPGVIARIEDRATARTHAETVARQLADAAVREEEARRAIQEAREATEAARSAAREAAETARRTAEEHAATEVERQRLEEQQRAIEAARQEQAARLEAMRQEEALRQEQARREQARQEEERQQELARAEQERQEEQRRQAAAAQQAAVEAAAARVADAPEEEAVAALGPAAPEVRRDDGSSPARDEVPDASGAGCTSQDLALVETSQVLFEPHVFSLDGPSGSELDRLAVSIRACAPRPVQLSGHADSNSDSLFNPALALQRAEAVRDALIARGVADTQIVTKFTPPGLTATIDAPSETRSHLRRTDFRFLEAAALTRDATQGPDERATNCQDDLSRIMTSSIIHFGTGSARVSPESVGLIIRLATAIRTCGSVIVTIEGHTDKLGLPARNQRLSEERALSVREALISAGADPTRLATRGYASSRPFDAKQTAEAYALNRRIEFRVSGKFTSTNAGGP